MTTIQKMDWENWVDEFKPALNPIDNNASFDGYMFETYGEEFKYVYEMCQKYPKRIWTLVTDDDDELLIINGLHFVNRLGYFITDVQHTPLSQYEITP